MADPTPHRPPEQRKNPSLRTVWLIIMALAALWCILPLWETAFIGGSWPGVYWLFFAGNVALNYVGIAIGVMALVEVAMIVVLATRRRSVPGRDDLSLAAGIGFIVLLLLFARAGIAVLSFTPAIDKHMGEIETGQHRYFLAHHTAVKPTDVWYAFVQCDSMGVWCSVLHDLRTDGTKNGTEVTPQAELKYDGDLHAIEVFEIKGPFYIYKLDPPAGG